jgi:hypothetical protein
MLDLEEWFQGHFKTIGDRLHSLHAHLSRLERTNMATQKEINALTDHLVNVSKILLPMTGLSRPNLPHCKQLTLALTSRAFTQQSPQWTRL